MNILVTGGAGFIGSALIRFLIAHTQHTVICLDKLTYAGNRASLASCERSPRYFFEQADICDRTHVKKIFLEHQPDAIMHLAAESHVDRSINGPAAFIETNIVGTYTLLEESREYWEGLAANKKEQFRFHHISTDEVYGDLGNSTELFTESTPYAPSSPYSASKASSDHLVRVWHRTYGFPILITNCSNNYGPYQHHEKFIPVVIRNALMGKPLPLYGDGSQIRDWLYVEDHVRALYLVLSKGLIGETYNIGGSNQMKNRDVAQLICSMLEDLRPVKPINVANYEDLICFVKDRPGHDIHYAIDSSKISNELGWKPFETFISGMEKTIKWYIDNMSV